MEFCTVLNGYLAFDMSGIDFFGNELGPAAGGKLSLSPSPLSLSVYPDFLICIFIHHYMNVMYASPLCSHFPGESVHRSQAQEPVSSTPSNASLASYIGVTLAAAVPGAFSSSYGPLHRANAPVYSNNNIWSIGEYSKCDTIIENSFKFSICLSV